MIIAVTPPMTRGVRQVWTIPWLSTLSGTSRTATSTRPSQKQMTSIPHPESCSTCTRSSWYPDPSSGTRSLIWTGSNVLPVDSRGVGSEGPEQPGNRTTLKAVMSGRDTPAPETGGERHPE